MKATEVVNHEIDILIDAIKLRYGYDFKDYARTSLKRRLLRRVEKSKMECISDMVPKIMHDPQFFCLFLQDMSITVTEMFRDPFVFKSIRENIVSHLHTYSRINIWHAGCATGEEAYSMAILLEEEGLLSRCRIYATDYNNHSLDIAKKGIYSADKINKFNANYEESGGRRSFSRYYHENYESFKINSSLKDKITFANHNLMYDKAFAQMHLVLCRNVMIYFNRDLQNRCLKLFKESIENRCFLILGDKENIDFTEVKSDFDVYQKKESIYRKKKFA